MMEHVIQGGQYCPPFLSLSFEVVFTNNATFITIPRATTFSENTIAIVDPMPITWMYRTASGQFFEAGTSENQVYVTWMSPCPTPPCTSPLMHTVLHTGCQAANGVTGTPGTDDHLVLDAVWENAFDRDTKTVPVRRVSDQKLLSYYGFFDANGNGDYDVGEGRNDTEIVDAAGLVETGNGQCHSWAEFLYDVMKAQGLTMINGNEIQKVRIEKKTENAAFAVKNWETSGDAPWTLGNTDAGIDGSEAVPPAAGEACDAEGVPGQGTSPNPPAYFIRHFIVYMNGHYYDPSYGIRMESSDPKAYEDEALTGRIYYDAPSLEFRMEELPDDNGSALDTSDQISTYTFEDF